MSRLRIGSFVAADPAVAAGHSAELLDRARRENAAILHAYELPGDVLWLGRYHLFPAGRSGAVAIGRRLGGGRVAPLGAGFVGVCLALSQRGALTRDDPATLAPEQVLNRCVRGLLGALEHLGVRGYYPGRDLVTSDGRIIAAMGFETRDDGATIVEMTLAVGRSYAEVARFADVADPEGTIPLELVLPDRATCVAAVAGRVPTMETIRAALASGYAERLGVTVDVEDVEVAPTAARTGAEWLRAGVVAEGGGRRATGRSMLGSIEVDVRVDGAHVAEVRVGGDLIAPSSTIAGLEAALRGAPRDRDELRARVRQVLSEPGRFVLGLADAAVIADLVLEASAA